MGMRVSVVSGVREALGVGIGVGVGLGVGGAATLKEKVSFVETSW